VAGGDDVVVVVDDDDDVVATGHRPSKNTRGSWFNLVGRAVKFVPYLRL
jgi:hypothetical protein